MENKQMKYLCMLGGLMGLFLTGCQAKIEANVPQKMEQCIKDDATNTCTSTLTVRHVITLEIPKQFTNDCETRYKDYPEPDRSLAIQACINDYTQSIIDLINGIQIPESSSTQNGQAL